MYQTQQVPGFTRLSDTNTKADSIYTYEDNKLQDGGFRAKFNSGSSSFGQCRLAKSKGGEKRYYRLFKSASGNIQYQECIEVFVPDKGWTFHNKHTFNPDKLEWNKN